MKIVSVVGARPNFMKIAPFIPAIVGHNRRANPRIDHILVHTGQHYDVELSRAFFESLDIPDPDINLGVGSGSHARQVGQTMMEFEKVLRVEKPDWVVVVGDVNATLACSVTAKKEWVKCCHIEAGLRSGDMTMPEEINRIVTDRVSDLLLTPDEFSSENLRKEGVSRERIRFVGNIMIDTLEAERGKAELLSVAEVVQKNAISDKFRSSLLSGGFWSDYGVITMHRPSNVDQPEVLGNLVGLLCQELCSGMPFLWPIHPRTEKRLKEFGLWGTILDTSGLFLLHSITYHEMLRLNMGARVMLTDSGGLQEECCVLGTPCLTLRWNTERPITLREYGGTSVLVGNDVARIRGEFQEVVRHERRSVRPELWDGKTAERCLEAILIMNGA